MTTAVADGIIEIVVPATVIAPPPGESVCPDMTYCVCGLGAMVWVPNVSAGGSIVGG